jgi:hypothetical protein
MTVLFSSWVAGLFSLLYNQHASGKSICDLRSLHKLLNCVLPVPTKLEDANHHLFQHIIYNIMVESMLSFFMAFDWKTFSLC